MTDNRSSSGSEAVRLVDARLADLRNANDVFREMDWDKSREIQRNDREIRWLIDFRALLITGVAQAETKPKWANRPAGAFPEMAPSAQPQTLWGMIAAIYGSLDAEDCKRVDREWARMRGYILPTDGTSRLSSTSRATACQHAAILSLDGKWHCQKCGDAIEMAVAHSSTDRGRHE